MLVKMVTKNLIYLWAMGKIYVADRNSLMFYTNVIL